jgi:hypothetical protein
MYAFARRMSVPRPRTPWYPDDLLLQIQQTLGALADIEFRFETERQRLQASSENGQACSRLAEDLERRYQAEREPCIQSLTDLQDRLTSVMGLQAPGSTG